MRADARETLKTGKAPAEVVWEDGVREAFFCIIILTQLIKKKSTGW